MTPPILSTLALAGLWPFLGATPQEVPPPKSKAQKEEPASQEDAPKSVWEYLSTRYDADGDGKIDPKEYTRGKTQFERLDKDKNGFIEEADTKQQGRGGARGERGQRGNRGGAGRPAAAPTEGSEAPDFELETLYPVKDKDAPSKKDTEVKDKETPPAKSKAEEPAAYGTVKLSSLKGKKPVALIFGSYT